jgi:hypothetical protein
MFFFCGIPSKREGVRRWCLWKGRPEHVGDPRTYPVQRVEKTRTPPPREWAKSPKSSGPVGWLLVDRSPPGLLAEATNESATTGLYAGPRKDPGLFFCWWALFGTTCNACIPSPAQYACIPRQINGREEREEYAIAIVSLFLLSISIPFTRRRKEGRKWLAAI